MSWAAALMVVSIALQLVVVALALRLIPITGRRSAWVFLAAAAALMAVRRILLMVGETLGADRVIDISDASTIVISILMIVGIARIEPIFRSWRRSEATIRATEERYRKLVDSARDAIVTTDAEGRIVSANPATAAMLGYSSTEEILGRHAAEFYVDQQERQQAIDLLRTTGFVQNYQARLASPENPARVVHVLANATLRRDEDRRVTGTEIIFTDISDWKRAEEARRQSEARLRESEAFHRTLLEQSFDGILVLGPDMNVQYRSPSIARIMGRPPEARVGNALWRDDLHPSDYARVAETEAHLRRSPGKPVRVKLRVRRGDGEYRLLEVQAVNLFHDPTVRGIVVNFRDITDEATLQEQLQRAQKMEGVGRLAGGIAHDFNNLLTVVLGAASLGLESAPRGGELRAHLQSILDYGRRASALTRRLLTFARRTAIEPKAVDLNTLIEDARRLIASLVGEDIRVIVRAAEDLWPVKADPVQIEQVLVNLAANARDAMPDGGTFTLETRNVTVGPGDETERQALPAGDYVLLTAADTGTGMDTETRAHLFEPFFTTKGEKGTGLGLATCYGIVTQHGGLIACDSQRGAGASFRVYLPRSQDAPGEATAIPNTLRGRGERILVVEDEPLVLNVAVQSLRRYGYEVVPASSGPDALAIMDLRAEAIDLVVTDLVMPGIGGQALADALRARWPKLRIVFASGYAESLPINPGALPAGTAFLSKPYTPVALAEKVRDILDGR
jgi:PAS domain S-box-containing protein